MVTAPLRLRTLPGVFSPHSDACLLAAVMAEQELAKGADVLDVFTGSGVLALCAARLGARSVTAIDVSRRAQITVGINARRNGVRVRALRGDLFAPVKGESFDLIVANPPYLPGNEMLPRRGAARAWEGGPDGRLLVDRFLQEAPRHVRAGGSVLIVHSSLTGEEATVRRLTEQGLSAGVLARQLGPLGPLARAGVEQLRTRGVLANGVDREEVLVIGAAAG
jgi:release factor glutamine methyltransferase